MTDPSPHLSPTAPSRAHQAAAREARWRALWQSRSWRMQALRPVAMLHGLLLGLRRRLYAWGWLAQTRLPVPVVVVGNLVVGGAGKTPTTLSLIAHWQAQGLRVGVISRGYGRQTQDCRAVHADDDPAQVGDEPLLLAQRTGVPVYVAQQRAEAGQALLAAHPDVQLLVCDDGLQHLALARDLEIAVFDERGVGNGWLLPAGPLREPWPRSTDLALLALPSGTPEPVATALREALQGSSKLLAQAHKALAPQARSGLGDQVPLASLRHQPVNAVAGIAKPEVFFDMLRQEGLQLARTVALPDHDDLQASANLPHGEPLLCTEKDAVKLWRTRPQALAVPLTLTLPDDFLRALDARLAPLLRVA